MWAKPSWILFEMDYMVFVYFAAACLVSAVLFGLMPGLQASRVDLNATLKEGSRDSGSKRGGILSGALVVFQFMLAVVLLAGAGPVRPRAAGAARQPRRSARG